MATLTCSNCGGAKPVECFSFEKARGNRPAGFRKACRSCRNEQRYARRKQDIEGAREKSRVYYANNREKAAVTSKASRQKHKVARAAGSRKYERENREKVREMKRSWQRRNAERCYLATKKSDAKYPEKRAAARAAWLSVSVEKTRQYARTRRALKKSIPGSHSEFDVADIRAWQRDKCACCRVPLRGRGEVDHIIALSNGGSNDRRNLQLLCVTCNRSKATRVPEEFMRMRGYLL